MKRLWIAIVLLGVSVSAGAQTPAATPAPDGTTMYISAIGGATVARKSGTLFGAQVGMSLTDTVDVFGEVGRMTNVPNKAMNDGVGKVAEFLASLGKGAVSSKAKAPANYATIGLRYRFTPEGRYVPYLSFGVGGATVEKKPTFGLGGTDITGSLQTYGVALGKDLAGKSTRAMATVGAGLRIGSGSLFIDASLQYGRIFTKDQGTDVGIGVIGLGYRF